MGVACSDSPGVRWISAQLESNLFACYEYLLWIKAIISGYIPLEILHNYYDELFQQCHADQKIEYLSIGDNTVGDNGFRSSRRRGWLGTLDGWNSERFHSLAMSFYCKLR